jgi:hypothetical protein
MLAFLNGTTPYLGFKTIVSYSMFSNLRTEGGQSNHLLIPSEQFFLFSYQNDLAFVRSIGLHSGEKLPPYPRWFKELPIRVPFAEIRRAFLQRKDLGLSNASIIYKRSERLYQVKNVFEDPEIMKPSNFFEKKFLAFRAVQNDGEVSQCRW